MDKNSENHLNEKNKMKQEEIESVDKKEERQDKIEQIEEKKKDNEKKPKKTFIKKKYFLVMSIIIIAIIGAFTLRTLTSIERKIEIISTTIEASKTADLKKNIKIKDKYKDKFEISVKKSNDDYTKLGKHSVTYIIINKDNNKTQELIKEFDVVDTTPPSIKLEKEIISYLGEKFNIKKHVKATDIVDGKIMNKNISVKGKVDINKEGTYKLTVTAKDSAGNTKSKKTTVQIIERQGTIEELARLICNDYGKTWLIPNNHYNPSAQFTLSYSNGHIIYGSTDNAGYLDFNYIKSDYSYVVGEAYFFNPELQFSYEETKNYKYNEHTYFEFDLSQIKYGKLIVVKVTNSSEHKSFLVDTYENSF